MVSILHMRTHMSETWFPLFPKLLVLGRCPHYLELTPCTILPFPLPSQNNLIVYLTALVRPKACDILAAPHASPLLGDLHPRE